MSSAAIADELGPACTEYFKQIDQILAASPQSDAMKPHYESTKESMRQMPGESQETACKQAADLISQSKGGMPTSK